VKPKGSNYLDILRERIIKDFLDVLILVKLMNLETPLSGYDIIRFFNKEFNTLISSGTIYSLLYSMEREGLVRGVLIGGKRVYAPTEKGKEVAKEVSNASDEILSLVKKILMKIE